jgi:hypothetical protein
MFTYINPYEIFDKDSSENLGVIIDCKNTETPSLDMDLDQKLGLVSLESARQVGFKNIVLFEDRLDFDIAVQELVKEGVEKIIYVFSGALFGNKSPFCVKRFPHLSACVIDNFAFRKFFIFETDKYKFFDIRDPFLGNIIDELTHVTPELLDLAYLNPYEDNYKFLEDLANRQIPNIGNLTTTSYHDKEIAKSMIKFSENIFK